MGAQHSFMVEERNGDENTIGKSRKISGQGESGGYDVHALH